MEIDSKPEEMDKLDRRLIQLKIEREAVKKEKDEASQKRLALIEDEIVKLGKEAADLEEIWKAEKAAAQGGAQSPLRRIGPPSGLRTNATAWCMISRGVPGLSTARSCCQPG